MAEFADVEDFDTRSGRTTTQLTKQAATGRIAIGCTTGHASDRMIGHGVGQVGVVHGIAELRQFREVRTTFEVVNEMPVDG